MLRMALPDFLRKGLRIYKTEIVVLSFQAYCLQDKLPEA